MQGENSVTNLLLLEDLTDTDFEWILFASDEKRIKPKEILIKQGEKLDSIYILLQGMMRVYLGNIDKKQIRFLGAGELLGEMSLVEGKPSSASIEAIEESLILSLSHNNLNEKIKNDPAFGLRFFKSIAKILSSRLRNINEQIEYISSFKLLSEKDEIVYQNMKSKILILKTLFTEAEDKPFDSKAKDILSFNFIEKIQNTLQDFFIFMNEFIGDKCTENIFIREDVGIWIKQEILCYLLLSQIFDRWYTKPSGYAGDYFTIELMYQKIPNGVGNLGKMLDHCFLNIPPVKAVQNRRGLLAKEILDIIKSKPTEEVHITSMACGPAREIFDVYQMVDHPKKLRVNLIDIDEKAIEFVKREAEQFGILDNINLVKANLIYLARGRINIEFLPQDLVYTIGLIDYFTDKYVLSLINYIYKILKPGGKVILGNFYSESQYKAFMDYLLEWKLIHRNEEDMNRLFSLSDFKKPCSRIFFENEKINLFAECIKS